jgi:hypothetical protein
LVSEKVSRDTFSVSEVTSGNLEGFRDSRIWKRYSGEPKWISEVVIGNQ